MFNPQPTLHNLLKMKTENSSLKSVFITEKIFEDCLIIEVEPYDQTGYNALETSVSRFDSFYEYLNKTIVKNFEKITTETRMVRVCIYSDAYPCQYILTNTGNVY